ncbi:two-component system, OmpR family, sensor histidine kinase BaeS [Alkalispirochaeta americana]|uniref:histidine kinase n=1 Tax=Alkalispirochaeta americana TaxID=159291 RepID=A0A1N6QS62_9SPIO|nr:HAMP domain-containing sensor histidine kinase [Alkalispirochaeta americana]SIQ19431.1 two-component system, OmpR family, sensor histidine kinase BaeS [Alkalispirochaeta americana]
MTSLFRRTLGAFSLMVLLLTTILAAGLFSGYNRSITAWGRERESSVEPIVRDILTEHRKKASTPEGFLPEALSRLPLDVPVFIFDTDREMIYSNRGAGRRREAEGMTLAAVRDDQKRHLGYYTVGAAQFHRDAANLALQEALFRAALGAILAAGALAMIAAGLLARYLAHPAAEVASGIDRIATGENLSPIPEVGAQEISTIARSANILVRRLQEEQHLRAQWVRDVVHDLRSPVAMVTAQLEAIADGIYAPEEQRIHRILTELGRVEGLIQNLDELMRLEASEIIPDIKTFSLEALQESLRNRFDDAGREKNISLFWEIAPSPEEPSPETSTSLTAPSITGDQNLLYRATANLLDNAIRYTPPEGTIRCILERMPGEARITVTNSGAPIPPDELPHLFDRLYRGEYARNTPGSGLGLTIALRIARIHQGSITATSSSDQGTSLVIIIPQ